MARQHSFAQIFPRRLAGALLAIIPLASCLASAQLSAAPRQQYTPPATYASSDHALKNQVENCTVELNQLRDRIAHLEELIEGLQSDLAQNQAASNSKALQGRVETLEATSQNLTADLRQLKNHGNSTATTLGQYRQSLADIEKSAGVNKENVQNLEVAVRSLMDLLQRQGKTVAATLPSSAATDVAEADSSNSQKVYRVKSGDTLDKIARNHGTTVQALKELNQLKKEDLIIVGQELYVQ